MSFSGLWRFSISTFTLPCPFRKVFFVFSALRNRAIWEKALGLRLPCPAALLLFHLSLLFSPFLYSHPISLIHSSPHTDASDVRESSRAEAVELSSVLLSLCSKWWPAHAAKCLVEKPFVLSPQCPTYALKSLSIFQFVSPDTHVKWYLLLLEWPFLFLDSRSRWVFYTVWKKAKP